MEEEADDDDEEEDGEYGDEYEEDQGLESLLALASKALEDAAVSSASSTPAALPSAGQWKEKGDERGGGGGKKEKGDKREREVEKNGRRGGRGREKEWEERGRKKKKNAGVCGAIIRLVGYIKGGKRGGGGKRQGRGGRGEEGEIERESTYSLHPEKARSLRHLPLRFWKVGVLFFLLQKNLDEVGEV